jgi:hypothetical protein
MSAIEWLGRFNDDVGRLKGAWIALSEDGVVCRGSTAKEVLAKAKEMTEKRVIVFKVPRKDEETHVLWVPIDLNTLRLMKRSIP